MIKKSISDNLVIAKEVKIGICKRNPIDGFVISFKGKNISTDAIEECTAIIPVDGIQDILQGLFEVGINYQKETGIDIGFSDVVK